MVNVWNYERHTRKVDLLTSVWNYEANGYDQAFGIASNSPLDSVWKYERVTADEMRSVWNYEAIPPLREFGIARCTGGQS